MTEKQQYWILETKHCGYAFGLNKNGILVNTYWGKRLDCQSDYPVPPESDGWASFNGPTQILQEEYPAYGGMCFHEPCLKATFVEGVRDVVLQFESEITINNELVINLRDIHYPLKVSLHYRSHTDFDLIERWVEVENFGKETITLERVFSAIWHFPIGGEYFLSHLTGRWNDEFNLVREPLTPGVKVLESRRITSSHHHNPWFLVDDGNCSEDNGKVWFGALSWSGNWKATAEVTNFYTTRLGIGINDWDFVWQLKEGEIFSSPHAICGFSDNGYGEASRLLHNFIRDELVPHKKQVHKVLYNSWEATFFDVNEPSQAKLAEIAAEIGVELFVVDDGWFHRRNNDKAGLGDWWPDSEKFPHGLTPLIEKVNRLNMDFGLWIEPEMVNPDSDLYRKHPDWILHYPTRQPTLARNQMILNMARPDVQEYIFSKIDRLLTENNIAFIKWDMNRNVSEPGWPSAPGDQREIWVRYVEGVYKVWGDLRKQHPGVIWQSCSGGGGRADLGIINFADQIWVSDNTFALDRLRIQYGFSQIFPAVTMESWVTDADRGKIPLEFRFHVSMCGSLGVGGNLLLWDKAEIMASTHWISHYKKHRQVIQFGDQYRLSKKSMQYMSKDAEKGVLFVFQTESNLNNSPITIHLRGLNPELKYKVEGLQEILTGAEWMSRELSFPFKLYESAMLEISAC
ncbi:MAG: alpha-galactosidase [Chloroflexi bacterium HGW-Chloroflexi-5]|jgi:alpha-galactosidase|nr:MAG: alpha-galactosidase [Chloroflexi bacterium HGW-Chloroflexi-5]